MKVRKKPVEVEAIQLDENASWSEIAEWCGGRECSTTMVHPENWGIEIETLEGVMRANYGDWIIKGVNGEFYPCKSDIFDKTYDIIGD